MGGNQIGLQIQRLQTRLAGRFNVPGIVQMDELQNVGATQIGESGSEAGILLDSFLQQRNRSFQRVWPVVVLQKIVRLLIVVMHSGDGFAGSFTHQEQTTNLWRRE